MDYPSEFSSQARAAVEAQMIRARARYLKAKQDWQGDRLFDDESSARTWILSVFLVYARQAVALGAQDVWTVEKVRANAMEGLRRIIITVASSLGLRHWIAWGGSIQPEFVRQLEAAPEWQQFQGELLALAEAKSEGAPAGDDPDQSDLDAFPLGANPFPEGHAASEAFEEATWNAKDKISKFKSEFLQTPPSSTSTEFLQAVLTYRKRWFSVCAHEATLIVGNKETALWYERWIDERATFLVADTLGGLRRRHPKANPGDPPVFTAEELENVENDLTLELTRMVAHYKGVAAERVQEISRLRKAQLSDVLDRLEKAKPILPDLSSAALARVNAARERCDALVGKAQLKHEDLAREAQRAGPYEHQRATELRRQAHDVLQEAQNAAAVQLLDAQATEFICLVGDPFPYQTLEILASTSVSIYGGEDAVRLQVNEWRARWWERKAVEAATPSSPLDPPVVTGTKSEQRNTTNSELEKAAEPQPGTTPTSGERETSSSTEEALEGFRQAEADNPEWAQRRQKEATDLTAVYSRYQGRNPGEAANQEALLHDAREYAAMSLTSALEELELPRNASETNIEDVCEKIRDRIVLDALKNYVPLHPYSSNFLLGAREFKSVLWTEGLPSLEDRARAVIERLVASVGVGGAFGIGALEARSAAATPEAAASRRSKLNVARITEWMRIEGHTNKDLADILKVTVRTVSSLRNNGEFHGFDAVTRLANEMKCEPEDLYLP